MTRTNVDASAGVLVFGASGHAKVVIDAIEKSADFSVRVLADDNPALKGGTVYGYQVIGGKQELLERQEVWRPAAAIVAIGINRIRAEVAAWLEANGIELCPAICHPSVQLARGVTVGAGSIIMAGALINADARIGRNAIINTGAIVEHDCVIGDAVHVAPGSTLCGGIAVGDNTLVGAGAVIHPNLRIGKNVTIGAGATVIRDIPDGQTVVGTPATAMRR
ncbi:MAG: acetyltransferase [Gallionella sp.]|nr:acetyltransferase [Gallionella sp.]MDD4945436.1 acetyltransferase [Gallionella sp.]MDD5611449.1 acetyltransferase [Gallionella sp.]